jgi:hypothetical protein
MQKLKVSGPIRDHLLTPIIIWHLAMAIVAALVLGIGGQTKVSSFFGVVKLLLDMDLKPMRTLEFFSS